MKCVNYIPLVLAFGLSLTLTSEGWSSDKGKAGTGSAKKPLPVRPDAPTLKLRPIQAVPKNRLKPGSSTGALHFGDISQSSGKVPQIQTPNKPLPTPPGGIEGVVENPNSNVTIDGVEIKPGGIEEKVWKATTLNEVKAQQLSMINTVKNPDLTGRGSGIYSWGMVFYQEDQLKNAKVDLIRVWRKLKDQAGIGRK